MTQQLQSIQGQSLIITAYFIYLPIAILLTFFTARILFKNGKVFMLDIFQGREDIAGATNRLFELGFYLLNFGFALLIMQISYAVSYSEEFGQYIEFDNMKMMEVLSRKIGGFSIYLGLTLFLNLYLFFRGKRKSNEHGRHNGIFNTEGNG